MTEDGGKKGRSACDESDSGVLPEYAPVCKASGTGAIEGREEYLLSNHKKVHVLNQEEKPQNSTAQGRRQ